MLVWDGVLGRGHRGSETLGTGDQAFKEKSLIVTVAGPENISVYHCKLVDIFTTELTIQSHIIKDPRKTVTYHRLQLLQDHVKTLDIVF